MLRCCSAESIRFFLASIDHVILWWRTHTQIEVYRKRNDSRHAIDLHAMSWILTASLACCRSCLPSCSRRRSCVRWRTTRLKFLEKLVHSKVSSENSFFLDFNLFYDASLINCQFNPKISTLVSKSENFISSYPTPKHNTFPTGFETPPSQELRDLLYSSRALFVPCPPFDHSK